MIVISDTTPLITLIKAGKLDVLHSLFGEVLLPEAPVNSVCIRLSETMVECPDELTIALPNGMTAS